MSGISYIKSEHPHSDTDCTHSDTVCIKMQVVKSTLYICGPACMFLLWISGHSKVAVLSRWLFCMIHANKVYRNELVGQSGDQTNEHRAPHSACTCCQLKITIYIANSQQPVPGCISVPQNRYGVQFRLCGTEIILVLVIENWQCIVIKQSKT